MYKYLTINYFIIKNNVKNSVNKLIVGYSCEIMIIVLALPQKKANVSLLNLSVVMVYLVSFFLYSYCGNSSLCAFHFITRQRF